MIAGWAAVLLAGLLQEGASSETRFHRVHLRNGNFVDGHVVAETEREVTLRLRIGEMSIRRDQVVRVEFVKIRELARPAEAVQSKPVEAPPARPAAAPVRAPEPPREAPSPDASRVDFLLGRWRGSGGRNSGELRRDIVRLGRDAIPRLGRLLGEGKEDFPAGPVCAALGDLGDAAAVPYLRAALAKYGPDERILAISALERIGAPECLEAVAAALEDASGSVVGAAAEALASLGQARGVDTAPLLVKRLFDAPEKGAIAAALGRLGGAEAREALRMLLGRGDEAERAAALQGLSLLADPADGPLVETVLAASVSPELRKQAALFVGKVKHRASVPDLIRLLGDEDAGVAYNAHWALKAISGQDLAADPERWRTWWEAAGRSD